jgi:FkbM family methyltransferase
VEADVAECERLNARRKDRHQYINAVLGRAPETLTLYVTRNPSCTSLLRPNEIVLAPFAEMRQFFAIERELAVTTSTLDHNLDAHGILYADFLELDVQGAELDVLTGAQAILRTSVLALQVEVEFVEMYERQPLFGDVDRFLRDSKFQLFDLARYRVRRGELRSAITTRGQLLWGQAMYLRRPEDCGSDAMRCRLAAVAALLGVPDFAVEILDQLRTSSLSSEFAEMIDRGRDELLRPMGTRVWRD